MKCIFSKESIEFWVDRRNTRSDYRSVTHRFPIPMQEHTQWTHSDISSQLATTPECSFEIGVRQREKNWWRCNRRVICDATHGTDTGRGVISHWGVSDGSDRAYPLWWRHSTWTDICFVHVVHSVVFFIIITVYSALVWGILSFVYLSEHGNNVHYCLKLLHEVQCHWMFSKFILFLLEVHLHIGFVLLIWLMPFALWLFQYNGGACTPRACQIAFALCERSAACSQCVLSNKVSIHCSRISTRHVNKFEKVVPDSQFSSWSKVDSYGSGGWIDPWVLVICEIYLSHFIK